ncbi:hypothetical protein SAMN05660662_1520 [Blastococcus aurantiacus]|uniref:Uncharacterized protein n=1 Tax=Blastococcus aurantiacus TaxID=1550231 RepID=A0A1G7JHY5_9ACTN|nr:hypothetical protein [Blastococcus aurantiacus]SDF24475.1 hypothetical protein SAMN05660662_1520 [Blastococcus aurantiacus]
MTTPSATNPKATDTAAAKRTADVSPQPATGGPDEMEELARTRDEAEDRARELLAAQVLQESRNGSHDERARQLVLAVRRDLLVELREQEQEQARRQLASAADSSEDAVEGLVQGVTTIVRSLVPAVLVRPEEVIETTYALADQSLRVTRRLALVLTQSVRSLVTA